ncbi:hypothetical protein KDK_69930 [Dictyobacter kobayashii]|uniref:Uncharacterized protein n=1 Tax=Dictyobacter kobayashii TaxID=2014872 RepID=A0A402AVY6_9CHLR|nr:hypothetical protein KDK_69930 [Dictyobacter kobayashii]
MFCDVIGDGFYFLGKQAAFNDLALKAGGNDISGSSRVPWLTGAKWFRLSKEPLQKAQCHL